MQGLCGGYCACLGRLHRGMRRAYPPPPDIKLPHSPTRYWRTISGLSVAGRNSRWCDSVGLLCSMVQVPGPHSSLCWLAWSYFLCFCEGTGWAECWRKPPHCWPVLCATPSSAKITSQRPCRVTRKTVCSSYVSQSFTVG